MRVLIVDDQEFIRRGVRAVLTEEEDIEVCGEAVDGRDGIAKALALKPDVILMDIRMPRLDGHRMLWRVVHEQVDVVYRTVPLARLRLEVSAHFVEDGFESMESVGVKDLHSMPGHKDQVDRELTNTMSTASHFT
jgi:DNA-binding NarL/FixJ family response regulator